MTYKTIKTDLSENILTITLNRPDRMNAFTIEMHLELIDAFRGANENDEVRVVIVTGAEKAFCAGMDLGGGGDTFDNVNKASIDDHRDEGGKVVLQIFESTKPVIAAVNGAAVGVGATMQLPMDIRIASERAKFGFVFARRGITAEACSSWFLPRLVGIQQAMEWVATGRVFTAQEALAGGLVSRVVPPEELIPAARAIAREIAENTSAVAVALSRQMMWRMLGADHPMEAHKVDSKAIYYMGASPDSAEGVTSFLEKRPAKFPMKVSKDMPGFYPWWPERKFKG
ncbi:MAG: crotonase/enoyl-CoA hydratase family protein [Candidatus Methylomirabilis sp.]|nr:crotonase/enoyl-CoA hydratase family protein [Deltaproteobacteria bacterium]